MDRGSGPAWHKPELQIACLTWTARRLLPLSTASLLTATQAPAAAGCTQSKDSPRQNHLSGTSLDFCPDSIIFCPSYHG
jgi:hypothetical protein